MERPRRKLVYELFISQFDEMSEVTIKYQAFDEGFNLLKQAIRLIDLLADDNHVEESQILLEKIENQREKLLKFKSKNFQGPELPQRMNISDNKRIRYQDKDRNSEEEIEVPSEDDNDEIYSYHQSVFAQIHATSSENLARFQHNDDYEENDYEISKSTENVHIYDETKL